jgi:hypothetical protein
MLMTIIINNLRLCSEKRRNCGKLKIKNLCFSTFNFNNNDNILTPDEETELKALFTQRFTSFMNNEMALRHELFYKIIPAFFLSEQSSLYPNLRGIFKQVLQYPDTISRIETDLANLSNLINRTRTTQYGENTLILYKNFKNKEERKSFFLNIALSSDILILLDFYFNTVIACSNDKELKKQALFELTYSNNLYMALLSNTSANHFDYLKLSNYYVESVHNFEFLKYNQAMFLYKQAKTFLIIDTKFNKFLVENNHYLQWFTSLKNLVLPILQTMHLYNNNKNGVVVSEDVDLDDNLLLLKPLYKKNIYKWQLMIHKKLFLCFIKNIFMSYFIYNFTVKLNKILPKNSYFQKHKKVELFKFNRDFTEADPITFINHLNDFLRIFKNYVEEVKNQSTIAKNIKVSTNLLKEYNLCLDLYNDLKTKFQNLITLFNMNQPELDFNKLMNETFNSNEQLFINSSKNNEKLSEAMLYTQNSTGFRLFQRFNNILYTQQVTNVNINDKQKNIPEYILMPQYFNKNETVSPIINLLHDRSEVILPHLENIFTNFCSIAVSKENAVGSTFIGPQSTDIIINKNKQVEAHKQVLFEYLNNKKLNSTVKKKVKMATNLKLDKPLQKYKNEYGLCNVEPQLNKEVYFKETLLTKNDLELFGQLRISYNALDFLETFCKPWTGSWDTTNEEFNSLLWRFRQQDNLYFKRNKKVYGSTKYVLSEHNKVPYHQIIGLFVYSVYYPLLRDIFTFFQNKNFNLLTAKRSQENIMKNVINIDNYKATTNLNMFSTEVFKSDTNVTLFDLNFDIDDKNSMDLNIDHENNMDLNFNIEDKNSIDLNIDDKNSEKFKVWPGYTYNWDIRKQFKVFVPYKKDFRGRMYHRNLLSVHQTKLLRFLYTSGFFKLNFTTLLLLKAAAALNFKCSKTTYNTLRLQAEWWDNKSMTELISLLDKTNSFKFLQNYLFYRMLNLEFLNKQPIYCDIGYDIDATASGPQLLGSLYKDDALVLATNLYTKQNTKHFLNYCISDIYSILGTKCKELFNKNFKDNLYIYNDKTMPFSDTFFSVDTFLYKDVSKKENTKKMQQELQQLNFKLKEACISNDSLLTYYDSKAYKKQLKSSKSQKSYNDLQLTYIEDYLNKVDIKKNNMLEYTTFKDIVCYYYLNSEYFNRDKIKKLVVPAVYGQSTGVAAQDLTKSLLLMDFNIDMSIYYKDLKETRVININNDNIPYILVFDVALEICKLYKKICEEEFPGLININRLFQRYSPQMLLTRGFRFMVPDGCEIEINSFVPKLVQINNSVMGQKNTPSMKRHVFTIKQYETYFNDDVDMMLPIQDEKSLRRGLVANIIHSLDAVIARLVIKSLYKEFGVIVSSVHDSFRICPTHHLRINELYSEHMEEVTTLFLKYSLNDIADRYFPNTQAKEEFLGEFKRAFNNKEVFYKGLPLCP